MRLVLRSRRTALIALAIGAAVAALALRGPGASPAEAPRGSSAPHGSATHAVASSVASATRPGLPARTTSATLLAGDASSHGLDRVAALRRGLASTDEGVRVAAVEAAVSATAIETLDDLEKVDLARDPEVAPTVIHAVALLGASAEGAKRDETAATLGRWLRGETARHGADAEGNVSNLVEALGNVGGTQAVELLGAALDRNDLALHVQTLAVIKLGELADARARGPIERFATRVGALPATEGLDEELRVEAIAAARIALTKLR